MSHQYVAIQWNARKRVFDYYLVAAVIAFLAAFVGAGAAMGADAPSEEILLLRAAGSAAFVLLHVVLAIGPLARLDPRFAPLLYNRRHLGVTIFLLGLVHAIVVNITYFGFTDRDPLYQILALQGGDAAGRFGVFPLLGLVALVILFLMAATSHDFWQKVMGPLTWKNLHMLVYLAYVLLVAHVAFGALRSEFGFGTLVGLGAGAATLVGLHVAAAMASRRDDRVGATSTEASAVWVDAGDPGTLALNRARGVRMPSGERVAVVHHEGGFSALHGVCAHQAGPLYEGRVIDGCLTCPWHGWQYRPADGRSPPPFEELLPTYRLRLHEGRLQVLDQALPPGTAVDPVPVPEGANR
jgi:DMSO/TMAO reductase YedYZ heme-binding membrane subunit/nitrite reductase/ring-hydroxylating ferredoxin subunit